MAKFAVFGSSYVTRLQRQCDGDLKVPGPIRFFGKGGMRADSIPRDILQDLKDLRLDVVVVQLGGNDIGATTSPNDIFDRLMDLKTDLHDAGIQQVYFVEIVRRGNFDKSPGLTPTSFNKQRNKINRLMRTRLRTHFIDLRVNYPEDYDRHLVHFNDSGLRTQFYAVRRPFLRHL